LQEITGSRGARTLCAWARWSPRRTRPITRVRSPTSPPAPRCRASRARPSGARLTI